MKKIYFFLTFVFLLLSFLFLFQQISFADECTTNCNNNFDCRGCGTGWWCYKQAYDGYGECQPPDGGGGGGANGAATNLKCNCTAEFGACGDKFGKTNIQWRQCQRKVNGTETCDWRVGLKLYQTKACEAGPTVTPGGPTLTPTSAPLPTDNPNCKCNALKNCTTQCQFEKFADVTTYSTPIKCGLTDSVFQTAPTADNKTIWCRAEKRTKGDADGDGTVTFKDYFYYVTAKLGFKIPPTANPDFNGDNIVDIKDRDIIVKSLLGN